MDNYFQNIFEQLADFHGISGYDGWMIGACVYEQTSMSEQDDGAPGAKSKKQTEGICTPEIAKASANFAVMRNQLEADGIRYRLELHVVKPEEQAYRNDGETPANPDRNKRNTEVTFSQTDILRFVDAVGDTNPIHRRTPAVVPGLLMVEWMLGNIGKLRRDMDIRCRFRFAHPVYEGDRLVLTEKNESKNRMYECRREEIETVWNVRIL